METLRSIVIEKQRPDCKNEPGPHAVMNYLRTWWSWIFVTEDAIRQHDILSLFGYSEIEDLRTDTTLLIEELREELGEEAFLEYFRE